MTTLDGALKLEHDLKKPIGTLKMFFDLYREKGATAEQLKEWEPLILRSVEEAVRQMKDASGVR